MRYMMLIYRSDEAFTSRSPDQRRAAFAAHDRYIEDLKRGGHYLGSEALATVGSATTLRGDNGKVVLVDGPFAETREQLGGYYLIEARDLDKATELARGCPAFPQCAIELRPVFQLSE